MTRRIKPARFADLRTGGNVTPARNPWWPIAALVLAGMMFAALVHADPIGRTADVMSNPHIEGF